jgi:FkbM family methyltransferase
VKVQLREFEFEVSGDELFWPGVHLWEPETFDIVKRYADPHKSFIDVGAWNGVVSLYASHLYNNVIAIEPDINAFDKLTKNINLNSCLNVTCQNLALSNANASSILNLSRAGDSMSSLLPREDLLFPIVDVQGVETRTFKYVVSWFNMEIGFIKMDIEGGELLVIPDMIDFLSENKTPIYISFHPFWFPEESKGHQILWLAEALFGIYPVVRDGQLNQVSRDQFIEGMNANSFSYIFDKK